MMELEKLPLLLLQQTKWPTTVREAFSIDVKE